MTARKEFIFAGYHCHLVQTTYHSGGTALQLVSSRTELATSDSELGLEEGEPIATASVKLEDGTEEGYCFIKDWAENEGMLEALLEAGLVEITGRQVVAGCCIAAEVKVL